MTGISELHKSFTHFFFNYSSTIHFNKKLTVTRHYIFRCAWESTRENLPQSQLGIEILI